MGLLFFLYAGMIMRTYVRAHPHIKKAPKLILLLLLRFYEVVFFEVTQCRNGGDTAWGARKMRAYGITSANIIKV